MSKESLLHTRIDAIRKQTLEKRLADARSRAQTVANHLYDNYSATRVFLIGSIVNGVIHEHSDIDIYVEGLKGNYWQAVADALRIASPFPVMVICAEDAVPSLREKVSQEGVLL